MIDFTVADLKHARIPLTACCSALVLLTIVIFQFLVSPAHQQLNIAQQKLIQVQQQWQQQQILLRDSQHYQLRLQQLQQQHAALIPLLTPGLTLTALSEKITQLAQQQQIQLQQLTPINDHVINLQLSADFRNAVSFIAALQTMPGICTVSLLKAHTNGETDAILALQMQLDCII